MEKKPRGSVTTDAGRGRTSRRRNLGFCNYRFVVSGHSSCTTTIVGIRCSSFFKTLWSRPLLRPEPLHALLLPCGPPWLRHGNSRPPLLVLIMSSEVFGERNRHWFSLMYNEGRSSKGCWWWRTTLI